MLPEPAWMATFREILISLTGAVVMFGGMILYVMIKELRSKK